MKVQIIYVADHKGSEQQATQAFQSFQRHNWNAEMSSGITPDTINEWINTEKTYMYKDHKVLFAVKYWYLDEFSCIFIPRNRLWFNAAINKIKETWNIILKERTDGYEHRASKKRKTVDDRTMSIISDDGIQMTVFSKVDNPICLIKLDDDGNVL